MASGISDNWLQKERAIKEHRERKWHIDKKWPKVKKCQKATKCQRSSKWNNDKCHQVTHDYFHLGLTSFLGLISDTLLRNKSKDNVCQQSSMTNNTKRTLGNNGMHNNKLFISIINIPRNNKKCYIQTIVILFSPLLCYLIPMLDTFFVVKTRDILKELHTVCRWWMRRI